MPKLNTPGWWSRRNFIAKALLPAGLLYRFGSKVRQHTHTPYRAPVPVLCIGNAVVGGAGKTPVALWIGKVCKARGIQAVFCSKGYGGTIGEATQVDPEIHSAAEVGDEPLLLAEILPTVVAKNRQEGVAFAASLGAELIIMDDGLQNPTVHKDMSLLVVDGYNPEGNGYGFPAGPMREPLEEAAKRVNGVIVIGGEVPESIIRLGVTCFPATLVIEEAALLKDKKVVGFAGIGTPEKFKHSLVDAGCRVADFIPFPDHYAYTEADMQRLRERARELRAWLTTTAKDAVRIPDAFKADIDVVHATLAFESDNVFWDWFATCYEIAKRLHTTS